MSLLEEFVIALRISLKTATPLQLKEFFPCDCWTGNLHAHGIMRESRQVRTLRRDKQFS